MFDWIVICISSYIYFYVNVKIFLVFDLFFSIGELFECFLIESEFVFNWLVKDIMGDSGVEWEYEMIGSFVFVFVLLVKWNKI